MVHPNAWTWIRVWAAIFLPLIFFWIRWPCYDCLTIAGFFRGILMLGVFLTDVVDGHTARKYNMQTDYGAWLDQFADKVLVTSLSIYFWLLEPALSFWVVVPMLIREWGIAFIRSQANIPVQRLGKLKVWSQAISFIMLATGFYTIGSMVYLLALFVAYWSAYFYVRQAFTKTA